MGEGAGRRLAARRNADAQASWIAESEPLMVVSCLYCWGAARTARRRDQLFAVNGSMICGTSVTRVTGIPLSSACWRTASSLTAR